MKKLFLLLFLITITHVWSKGCVKRFYWRESFVCVCNSTYCDEIEEVGQIKDDQVAIYSTDMKRDRLTRTESKFEEPGEKLIKVTIDPSKERQKIIGFGGCINDAVVYAKTDELEQQLLDQYYSKRGIEYSASRVPIGTNDASIQEWTYLDTPEDYELKTFSMDKDPKKDIIKKIYGINNKIKLFGSAWSVPAWLKDTGKLTGCGSIIGPLNKHHYVVYAKYLEKFLEGYFNLGVPFWGLTIMNEPGNVYRIWPGTYLSPEYQRDFVKEKLGPILKHNWITRNVTMIAHDWDRSLIYDYAKTIYQDKNTLIDGLGVHWYSKGEWEKLEQTHELRPDKFIWATEATVEGLGHEFGSWENAELYADDIINNLRRYVGGWVEWSLWTDIQGGPSYVGNFVGNSVAVNATGKEFYKQPQFYILGHFSKFLPPDSIVVDTDLDGLNNPDSPVLGVAARTPDNNIAFVVFNRHDSTTYNLGIDCRRKDGKIIKLAVKPHSIKTVIWKNTS
ncbi:unnamed protein product [Bursaphelenchus okinawaensis]|uniref:Glucosylceramidase n=1 Tax=Bursaphelenchus okinawaensis TaxID=465554 RepID=A0A811L4X9_9BILA|nr:unnamed protein product [Bursaphelenchus okinawaensis]CAG9117317.1 unnamed protein product [Bursaphelenchus okinawaensis]